MPKGNGYQSLHTTVLSHTGEPMEVQIRTQEMHETSEYGVAAHWRYKGGQDGARIDERFTLAAPADGLAEGGARRRGLRQHRQGRHLPGRGLRVHPAGDVRSLPQGSTPSTSPTASTPTSATAASAPRSTDGWCRSTIASRTARSSRCSPPRAPHGPSRDWLNFVKTSSAREKIRQWFKRERRDENIQKGREMLDKEFRRLRQMSLSGVKDDQLLELAAGVQGRDHRRLRRGHRLRRHQRAQCGARASAPTSSRPTTIASSASRSPARRRRPATCACTATSTCSPPWRTAASRWPATRSAATSPAARASPCTAPTA